MWDKLKASQDTAIYLCLFLVPVRRESTCSTLSALAIKNKKPNTTT